MRHVSVWKERDPASHTRVNQTFFSLRNEHRSRAYTMPCQLNNKPPYPSLHADTICSTPVTNPPLSAPPLALAVTITEITVTGCPLAQGALLVVGIGTA